MKTVLLVEDTPSILALIHYIVAQAGYAVLDAGSAEEAFQRFEESDAAVDLLIADLKLPSSSGVQVAMELLSLLPNLRTIICSGFPQSMWDDSDVAAIDELPFVMLLQKPFTPAALLDTIQRLIGWPSEMAPALRMKAAS